MRSIRGPGSGKKLIPDPYLGVNNPGSATLRVAHVLISA